MNGWNWITLCRSSFGAFELAPHLWSTTGPSDPWVSNRPSPTHAFTPRPTCRRRQKSVAFDEVQMGNTLGLGGSVDVGVLEASLENFWGPCIPSSPRIPPWSFIFACSDVMVLAETPRSPRCLPDHFVWRRRRWRFWSSRACWVVREEPLGGQRGVGDGGELEVMEWMEVRWGWTVRGWFAQVLMSFRTKI